MDDKFLGRSATASEKERNRRPGGRMGAARKTPGCANSQGPIQNHITPSKQCPPDLLPGTQRIKPPLNTPGDRDTPTPKLDLIWGAANIAREINLNTRQAFHHLETGSIPARKVGNKWVVERGKLRDFFLEGGE